MTEREDTSPIEATDDSRRSFMKKGALATGALALGGSAIGTSAAQETPEDGGGTQGADHVLMLHPDAVEEAEFTVVSGSLDWNPVGSGQAGTPTPDVEGTPTDGGTPTPGGAQTYQTHVIQYGFSASHVAHAFVPQDAAVEEGGSYQLGEIEEIVRQPGEGGSGDLQGDPTYVRVALQGGTDGMDGGGGTPEETPTDTPAETPTETPTDTPTETPTEEGDGGLFG